jgi:hypothetical protein
LKLLTVITKKDYINKTNNSYKKPRNSVTRLIIFEKKKINFLLFYSFQC